MSASNAPVVPSDADLVARALRGDVESFDVLVRRYYRAAFALALGVVGERADAEDVCQDAFVKALDRLDECRDPARFVQWMMVIVRNRALSYRSYRKVRDTSELLPETAAARDSPLSDVTRAELSEQLTQALKLLSQVQREVVLMHDMEGFAHKEIAGILKISEVRSRQHLFVARGILRKQLGKGLLKEYTHD
jgi:RNA polymerase sigma-70 factor (ECF subfamily)